MGDPCRALRPCFSLHAAGVRNWFLPIAPWSWQRTYVAFWGLHWWQSHSYVSYPRSSIPHGHFPTVLNTSWTCNALSKVSRSSPRFIPPAPLVHVIRIQRYPHGNRRFSCLQPQRHSAFRLSWCDPWGSNLWKRSHLHHPRFTSKGTPGVHPWKHLFCTTNGSTDLGTAVFSIWTCVVS